MDISFFKKHPKINSHLADEDGNIYSVYKKGLIRQGLRKDGYIQFNVRLESKTKPILSHRFIYECHFGLLGKMEINHKDGNKVNNKISNLEASTRSQNIRHSIDVLKNTHVKNGDLNANNKIKKKQYPQVKKMLLDGLSKKEIAAHFDVERNTILRIEKQLEFSQEERAILIRVKKILKESWRTARWKSNQRKLS